MKWPSPAQYPACCSDRAAGLKAIITHRTRRRVLKAEVNVSGRVAS